MQNGCGSSLENEHIAIIAELKADLNNVSGKVDRMEDKIEKLEDKTAIIGQLNRLVDMILENNKQADIERQKNSQVLQKICGTLENLTHEMGETKQRVQGLEVKLETEKTNQISKKQFLQNFFSNNMVAILIAIVFIGYYILKGIESFPYFK